MSDENCVASLLGKVCEIVFIHDILVYSKNEEEHAENLAVMLRLLREN